MKKIFACLFGLCLVVAGVVGAIGAVAFEKDFYYDFYDRDQTVLKENVREEDLDLAISLMVDYADSKRSDMDGEIVWNGITQPAFKDYEVEHMEDVRVLWNNAKKAGIGALTLTLVIAAGLLWKEGKMARAMLAQGVLAGFGAFVIFLVLLAGWAFVDFTSLWIQFHELFLSNSHWMLDPVTDFMIVACPEGLFEALIMRIVLVFGVYTGILVLISLLILRRAKRSWVG